jgi:hypothetical protein
VPVFLSLMFCLPNIVHLVMYFMKQACHVPRRLNRIPLLFKVRTYQLIVIRLCITQIS